MRTVVGLGRQRGRPSGSTAITLPDMARTATTLHGRGSGAHPAALAMLAAALLSLGCGEPTTDIPCNYAGDCPEGWICSDGLCVEQGGQQRDAAGPDRAADASASDRVQSDSLLRDVAASDGGRTDGSLLDAARPDLSPRDAAENDSGSPDASQPDGGVADTLRRDAARPDTAQPDTAQPDMAQPDMAQPDMAQPDTAQPDTAQLDIAQPDVAQPDTAQLDAGVAWWDEAWSHRRRLQLDNRGQAEALQDFPLPILLSPDRIDYTATADGGRDLRFVDPATGGVLPHEVERWVVSGSSLAWVKAPAIAAASDASSIWMYYGNSGAGDVEDAAAVWSAGYGLVLHLGDLLDSSPSGLEAVNHNVALTSSPLGMGRSFNGVDSYLDLGQDLPLLAGSAAATLSAWIRPVDAVGDQTVIALSISSATPTLNSRASIELPGSDARAVGRAPDSASWQYCLAAPAAPLAGAWHHFVGVVDYSGGEIAVYLDGQELGRCTVAFSAATTSSTPTSYNSVGTQDDASRDFFEGAIDEVRVAHRARSTDWIRAQYLAATDAFVIFGPEETR